MTDGGSVPLGMIVAFLYHDDSLYFTLTFPRLKNKRLLIFLTQNSEEVNLFFIFIIITLNGYNRGIHLRNHSKLSTKKVRRISNPSVYQNNKKQIKDAHFALR